jgi:lysozyme family protein
MEKESGPGQGVSNDARRSFLDTEMYEKYRGNMLAEMRAKSSAQATAKAPQAPSGPTVGAASAENSDIKSAPSAPVVIQAPQAGNSTTNNTTNNIMPRGDVRPNESAMERYSNNQSHFY